MNLKDLPVATKSPAVDLSIVLTREHSHGGDGHGPGCAEDILDRMEQRGWQIVPAADNDAAGSRLGSTTSADAEGPSPTETKARALGLRDVAPARNREWHDLRAVIRDIEIIGND